jgi:DNA (cytosine-5)-methyltransferase 1
MTLGIMEAARSLGRSVRIVLAMELEPQIRDIYRSNFRAVLDDDQGDVTARFDGTLGGRLTRAERETQNSVGRVDLLFGGPPCQGHSNLNNHTRWKDPKNRLYLSMVRAAEVLEPTAIVIENVPGVRKDKSRVLDQAVNHLRSLDYEIDENTVTLSDIGLPQRRIRHVLLATQKGIPSVHRATQGHAVATPRTLRWAIGDLCGIAGKTSRLLDSAARLSPTNLARANWLLRNKKYDLPNDRRPDCHKDPSHKYKSMYGRLDWDQPAQTITTGFGSPGQGRYLHPDEPRTITPHEAARLQFFPDWFDFSKAGSRTVLATCIGNAVPPKLAFVLGREVITAWAGRKASNQLQLQFASAP